MSSSALLSGVLPLSHRRVTARRRRQHVVVASWSSEGTTPPVGTRKPVASVVGAGIVGLTTALRLQEAGFDVTVTHAEDEHDLVSHGSGGFWFPYLVENMDRVGPWAKATYDTFLSEMRASPFYKPGSVNKDVPGGECVRMRDVLVFDDLPRRPPTPNWAPPDMRKLGTDELPPLDDLFDAYGVHISGGWGFRSPVVEMPGYMRALRQRVADAGGQFEKRQLTSLTDAAPHNADVVVNCAGMGARALCEDPELVAVRGQLLVVDGAELAAAWIDDTTSRPRYLIPRADTIVVGGTAQEGDERVEPDASESAQMLEDARAAAPQLSSAVVRHARVGMRPFRSAVRLEREARPDGGVLVHNYGHGGSGYTVSWGCADDVAALLSDGRQPRAGILPP